MNTLFGLGLPTPVNFVIAFVVVLGLIGAATWAVRRFGGTRLEAAAARNRQPRLAVIDSAPVDARRKLIIIRRDNVEHLLMVGGATDVVVEANIVRGGTATAREPAVRNGTVDTMPRAMALPDPTPWPLQPEPVIATPAVRVDRQRAAEEIAIWPTAAELVAAPPQVRAPASQTASQPISQPAETFRAMPEPASTPRPAPVQTPAPYVEPAPVAADDQNLADMAHRLEAALRRPAAPAAPPPRPVVEAVAPAVAPPEPKRAAPVAAPRVEVRPKPAPVEAKPAFKSLEQEMASLLGRPGKT